MDDGFLKFPRPVLQTFVVRIRRLTQMKGIKNHKGNIEFIPNRIEVKQEQSGVHTSYNGKEWNGMSCSIHSLSSEGRYNVTTHHHEG